MPQKPCLYELFPTIPHMNEIDTTMTQSGDRFYVRYSHRIGRHQPLNLPLWKYIYFTSWPVDTMFLNCSVVCVNDDIPHTNTSMARFWFPWVCSYGHEHLLVLQEFKITMPSSLPWSGPTSLSHRWLMLFGLPRHAMVIKSICLPFSTF